MSVSLSPSSSLGFNRPLTQLVKKILTITNHNDQPVAFKVKTTAPKLYCVRPNSGRVEGGESIEVQVLLQAMKEEPPLNAKCKDKFLVQSTLITPEKEQFPISELWSMAEGPEHKIHQQKIRVTYLPPVGEAVEEEDEGINQSSMMSSGDQRFDTVRQISTNGHGGHSSIFPEANDPLARTMSPAVDFSNARENEDEEVEPKGVVEEPEAPPVAAVPPPLLIPIPVPVPEEVTPPPSEPIVPMAEVPSPSPQPDIIPDVESNLRSQLADAYAEIDRLRQTLETLTQPAPSSVPSVRRRRRAMSDDATMVSSEADTDIGTMADFALQSDGIQPQVVIIIALGVFVTTYLFF